MKGVRMRRAVEAGLILCVLGGVILVVVFGPGALQPLTYHYERDLSLDAAGDFRLEITGFENCWLEISVRDDLELLYEVDLELYRQAEDGTDFEVTYNAINNQRELAIRAYSGLAPRKVTVAIGNALPLDISIIAHNLTSSVTLGNGAIFDDEHHFSYMDDGEDSGTLTLEFTDSLSVTGNVQNYASLVKTVNLVVDLPEGVSGILQLLSVGTSQVSGDGWSDTGFAYETLSSELPRLFVRMYRVNTVNADLSL
jgi:hypothetical protein